MDVPSDLGVEPTGSVDAATVTAFQEALTATQQTPSPSTPSRSPSPPPDTSDTPSPLASASDGA